MDIAIFRQTVLKDCKVPFDQLAFADSRSLNPSQIDQAIIFIYASWSGPSKIRWNALNEFCATNAHFILKVYVIDADEISPDFVIDQLRVVPRGYGELFCIRNGRIADAITEKSISLEDLTLRIKRAFVSQ